MAPGRPKYLTAELYLALLNKPGETDGVESAKKQKEITIIGERDDFSILNRPKSLKLGWETYRSPGAVGLQLAGWQVFMGVKESDNIWRVRGHPSLV